MDHWDEEIEAVAYTPPQLQVLTLHAVIITLRSVPTAVLGLMSSTRATVASALRRDPIASARRSFLSMYQHQRPAAPHWRAEHAKSRFEALNAAVLPMCLGSCSSGGCTVHSSHVRDGLSACRGTVVVVGPCALARQVPASSQYQARPHRGCISDSTWTRRLKPWSHPTSCFCSALARATSPPCSRPCRPLRYRRRCC